MTSSADSCQGSSQNKYIWWGSTLTRGGIDVQDTTLKMSLKGTVGTFKIIIWSENLR